MTATFQIPTNS